MPDDAPVGASADRLPDLPDAVIDLDLTPNRGDCFSVLGIARDVSALTGAAAKDAPVQPVAATIEDTHAVDWSSLRVAPVLRVASFEVSTRQPDHRSG